MRTTKIQCIESAYYQKGGVSIGVGEDLGESRTELVDIPDGCLSIQRIKSILMHQRG